MINLPVDFIGKNNEVHNVYKNVAGVPFPAGIQGVQGVQGTQDVQENNNQ